MSVESLNESQEVTTFAGELARQLLEFCMNNNIENPLISIDVKVKDGGTYKLTFERTDLD